MFLGFLSRLGYSETGKEKPMSWGNKRRREDRKERQRKGKRKREDKKTFGVKYLCKIPVILQ